jgi:hypothetical protein
MKKEIVDLRIPDWNDKHVISQKPTSVLAIMSSIVGDKIYLFYCGNQGNSQDWPIVSRLIGYFRKLVVLQKKK